LHLFFTLKSVIYPDKLLLSKQKLIFPRMQIYSIIIPNL